MRVVTVTKRQFDGVLYIALVATPSEDEAELATTVAIKQRFRPHVTLKALTPEEVLADKIPGWELTDDQAEIVFEEDEWSLLVKRLKKSIPVFTGHVAEVLAEVISNLKNAEKQAPAVALVDEEAGREGPGDLEALGMSEVLGGTVPPPGL